MAIGGTCEAIGENKEFHVAATSDVTVYFNGGSTGANTSENDTATEKYTDNHASAKNFCLRSDQAVQIVSINGVEFTSPYTCTANGSITEKLDTQILFKMVIRVLTAGTNIKLRVR